MSPNRKLATISALVMTVAIGYVGFTFVQQSKDLSTRNAEAERRAGEFVDQLAAVDTEPEEVVVLQDGDQLAINRIPGDDYGRVITINSDVSRTFVPNVRCERYHASGNYGLCLWKAGEQRYQATLYDVSENVNNDVLSWGVTLPSRARISDDGQYASYTSFASGTGYQDLGSFVTVIEVFETDDPLNRVRLSDFDYSDEDAALLADIKGKFWGVTWGDDGDFYVTWGNEEEIRIVKGSYADKTLELTDLIGSCPSLSPDGKTLVFKESTANGFELVALNLETNETTRLAETRSVDDQVEWLNDDTIAYALHVDEDAETQLQPEWDIWSLDIADETAEPELLLPQADSPTSYVEG